MGKLYLSGGGDEKQAFLLDKEFFCSLPQNGRFLYIPIALRGHELYAGANSWLKNVVALHGRNDLEMETADDLLKYKFEYLEKFDAIYIGGGNTWSLMKELKDSGFSNLIIKYLDAGGKIYGGSAGAIIFGKTINTSNDENNVGLENMSGLDLLHDYSVVCHFSNNQGEISKNLPIVCLPEETGLIIENGNTLCVGTKPCVVYPAEGARKELDPGETFNL